MIIVTIPNPEKATDPVVRISGRCLECGHKFSLIPERKYNHLEWLRKLKSEFLADGINCKIESKINHRGQTIYWLEREELE